MQNKPNLLSAQISVSAVITKDYANIRLPGQRKNKPNFNSRPVAATVRCSGDGIAYFPVSNLVFRASTQFMQNKPNLPNAKMNVTIYGHKDYENLHLREPRKNKPNLEPTATAHAAGKWYLRFDLLLVS